LTTKTVCEGETRQAGLAEIIRQEKTITFASTGSKWPGEAAVIVALFCVRNSPQSESQPILNGRPVREINSFLDEETGDASANTKEPLPLLSNKDLSFKGSEPSMGFVLEHAEATNIKASDTSSDCDYKDVIFDYINGDDLNSEPTQKATRSVINFFDWPEHKARLYERAFQIVLEKVYATWADETDFSNSKNWWWHRRRSEKLYSSISGLKRAIGVGFSSKYGRFSYVPTDVVFSNLIVVICDDSPATFSILNSSIHECWAWKYSSKLGASTLRYTPSVAFETYPFPCDSKQEGLTSLPGNCQELIKVGECYNDHRQNLMLRLWLGITDIYNLFHAPDLDARLDKLFQKRAKTGDWHRAENVPPEHRATAGSLTMEEAREAIHHLRDLHRQLDQAVLTAYAWHNPGPDGPAIDLGHDFHEVETLPENDRTRYTITPQARKDLLTRLLKLNHTRAAEEAAKAPPSKALKPMKAQRAKKEDELL
jgi:hypothetical protein